MKNNKHGSTLIPFAAALLPLFPVAAVAIDNETVVKAPQAVERPILIAAEDDDLGLLPESRRRGTKPAPSTTPAPAPATATTPAPATTVTQPAPSVAPATPAPKSKTAPAQTAQPPNPTAPAPVAAPTPVPVPAAPVAEAPAPAPAAAAKTVQGGMPYADFESITEPKPLPNRWTIVDALGYKVNYFDSYNTNNKFKGDEPLFGKDWFVSFQISSDTLYEPRYIPVPAGVVTTANSDTLDTIGDGKQTLFSQTFTLEHVLYKGDTTFKPPDVEFRFTPVINYTRVTTEERGLLNVDPTEEDSKGTERTDSFVGLQALFVDVHLRDVSPHYDFDTIRVGIQPFTADFRSFLFNDSALGVRLFGTRANNVFQYNVAYFRRYEKDTNSGLNDVSLGLRKDDVAVFNLFWQDLFKLGYTSEFVLLYNRNQESDEFFYDDNGFLVRPSSIFSERGRDYRVTYLGYNGDGHFGRVNVNASLYTVLGKEDSLTREGKENDVRGYFAAAEISRDYDWIRFRVSGLYASADKDPYDDTSEGFDAVLENPVFAGADTSYWIRQALPLIGGGGVTISGRNGVLNSLRSSKEEGQSNFTNPGTALFGIGGDFDVLPALRMSFNVNMLRFVDTTVLETLRQQADIDPSIGTDISLAAIWRPFLNQNMIVRFSTAWLIPGDGYKDLYGDDKTPYSVLANLILNY